MFPYFVIICGGGDLNLQIQCNPLWDQRLRVVKWKTFTGIIVKRYIENGSNEGAKESLFERKLL